MRNYCQRVNYWRAFFYIWKFELVNQFIIKCRALVTVGNSKELKEIEILINMQQNSVRHYELCDQVDIIEGILNIYYKI